MPINSEIRKLLAVCIAGIPLASFSITLAIVSFQLGILSWRDTVLFKGFSARILGIRVEDVFFYAAFYFCVIAVLLLFSALLRVIALTLKKYFLFFAAINASFSLFLLVGSLGIFLSSSTSLEPEPRLVFGLFFVQVLVAVVAVYRFGLKPE